MAQNEANAPPGGVARRLRSRISPVKGSLTDEG